MKISSNWLKEHIELGLSVPELSAALLKLGFEIAGVQHLGPTFTGVVVGKVLAKDKHPNADKLAVCVVDDGAKQWNVVCGAPNVAAGQTIAFARIGAVLPGNFKIEGRKLRGVESQGMICSRAELGLPKDVDGIWVMGEGPALGTDVGSLLGPADDVLEVEITSNRPDCLSHRGLARELAAALNISIKPVSASLIESLSKSISVSVEDAAACPFYGARLIEGVKVGDSPAWLKTRLESIGLRPVNNIVDITNFVLHDVGQPLHAFDADRLSGGKIIVRRAQAGEKFLALDHKEYVLPEGLLVIADDDKPVALAGVMGGEPSSVTAATTRVVLEGAYFAPSEVRRSSQKTRLRSDSSYRFERGADPEAALAAASRAAALILQLAGGAAAKATEAAAPRAPRAPIKTSATRINAILGTAFTGDEILGALKKIAAEFSGDESSFTFVPTTWRHDLTTGNDLAEEVGRFLGYERVPYRLAPLSPRAPTITPAAAASRRARARLCALGLDEAYNYDLLSEKSLSAARLSPENLPRVDNPLSEDWAVLRPSLLPGLLKNAQHNLSRGADAVRLFELGKAYSQKEGAVSEHWRAAGILSGPVLDARWQAARAPRAGFPDAKAAVEALLSGLGAVTWAKPGEDAAGRWVCDPLFHPSNSLRALLDGKAVATVGWLHPRAARAFDLDREGAVLFEANLETIASLPAPRTRFREFSPLPVSRRDLALVVDKALPYGKIEAAVRACAVAELQDVLLFDVYEGKNLPEGKKSLAIRLTFGLPDRTLTDAEVAGFVSKIVAALAEKAGAVLRG
ncbi:MAG TPA: phenylalanine--tRNA ligase subunit beta [Elusimicrobiota bacterium]|jgi:phenylalanyl-tRNA synthetase beta chain|nr:phenylalanine--tRNA ligase subunit beta [Elusimicrobiota bacterium]